MKKLYKSHPMAIIESTSIGKGTTLWAFAHIMKGSQIGEDCNIGDHCYIEGKSTIGNRVTIKNGVYIWEGVKVEDDVFIGPCAVFTNDLFPISRKHDKKHFKTTKIKRGACIGANATIICGVEIGASAFIGAGSVVTKNVGDFVLAYGNPAKAHGYLCKCKEKLRFIKNTAKCRCRLKYRLDSKHKVVLLEKTTG